MALAFKIENSNPQKVRLDGSIDESANLDEVFSKLNGNVVFDLKGIKKINSIGILRWVTLFGKYAKDNHIEVESLSYPLAIQAASISNLFGTSKIKSTLAPYYCASCENDNLVEITRSDLEKTNAEIPTAKCPKCGKEMTFDELPSYFEFMRAANHGK